MCFTGQDAQERVWIHCFNTDNLEKWTQYSFINEQNKLLFWAGSQSCWIRRVQPVLSYHDIVCCVLTRHRFAGVTGLSSMRVFCLKHKAPVSFSYFLDFLVQHPEELLLALRGVDAPVCMRPAGQIRDGGRKPCWAASNMTQLTESSRWNRLHPRVGLYPAVHFFPAGGTKVKIHLLIMKKAIRDAREARTVLSEPSTPPSSTLRYLTFSTPFILYSSVTERERSAPVSARAAAHLPLRSTRSRPLWWEQLFCYSEKGLCAPDFSQDEAEWPPSQSSMFRW